MTQRFNPTRRSVVTALAVLPTSAISADGIPPDAELIALGREFYRITASWDDVLQSDGDTSEINQLLELLEPVEKAIVATPAKTIDGLYVKAGRRIGPVRGKLIP